MRRVFQTLCFLCLTACAPAFSSFAIFGGAYHSRITRSALPEIVPSSFKFIDQGLIEPDKFYREKFDEGQHHFTDMDLRESAGFLKDRIKKIVEVAGTSDTDYQSYRETLFLFGGYLHTAQDFYAHTNWVERAVAAGRTPTLADIDGVGSSARLVSPYFLYIAVPPEEIVEEATYEATFEKKFYTTEQLESLSDQERIRLVADPDRAFTHWQLAKDSPDYPEAGLRWTSQDPTLFDIARSLAQKETKRRWKLLQTRLVEAYPLRSESLIRCLSGGWLQDLPAVGSKEVRVIRSRVRVSRDFELESRFVIKPDTWSRPGGDSAVELYEKLVSDEVRGRKLPGRGVQTLSLRRNDEAQTFEFHMKADLYGGAQTFLHLKPLTEDWKNGPWELRLSDQTPKTVRVTSVGRVLQKTPHLFVLEAPVGGWNLPDWIAEYVEE